MRVGILALMVAAAVPFQTLLAQPTAASPGAQATIAEATTSIDGHEALCLSRIMTQTERTNSEFFVLVPVDQGDDLKTRGFALAPCEPHANDFATYKASVCNMAQGNNAVQARLEHVLGVNARMLCAAARTLAPEGNLNAAD